MCIHRMRPHFDFGDSCKHSPATPHADKMILFQFDFTTHDFCTFYSNFGGIVLIQEEGERIVKALGNNKAAILQNHGPQYSTNRS